MNPADLGKIPSGIPSYSCGRGTKGIIRSKTLISCSQTFSFLIGCVLIVA